MADLDCSNRYCVRYFDGAVILDRRPARTISTDDALNLAAHLVALVDPNGARFLTLYAAITSQDESDVLATMDEAGPQRRARDEQRGADTRGTTDRVDAMDRIVRGVCPYCGADRSGPSAEAHAPDCPYAGAELGKPPHDQELGGEG